MSLLGLTSEEWVVMARTVMGDLSLDGNALSITDADNSYVLEHPKFLNGSKRYQPTINLSAVTLSFDNHLLELELPKELAYSIVRELLSKYNLNQEGYIVFCLGKPQYRKEKAHHLFFRTAFAVHPLK